MNNLYDCEIFFSGFVPLGEQQNIYSVILNVMIIFSSTWMF